MINRFKINLQFFGKKKEDVEGIDLTENTPEDATEDPTVETPAVETPTTSDTVVTDTQITATPDGLLGEQEWYTSKGLDPDADFQNVVNSLNYEYQTSLANYGQNAENLYQMGLSNSGVSDVFGANAFSAYIGAMNDAKLNYINTKKNNKMLYSQYVDQYNADVEQSITDAFNTYAEMYTEDQEDAIRQVLMSNGMSKSAVDQAIKKIESYQDSIVTGQTEKITDDNATIKDVSLEAAYNLIGEQTDEDTKQNIRNKAVKMVENALNNEQSLYEAYNLVGYDQAAWDSMPDGDKILAVMNAVGKYTKKGVITEDRCIGLFKHWIHNEFYLASESGSVNMLMTYAETEANILSALQKMYNNGSLTKETYNDMIEYVGWKREDETNEFITEEKNKYPEPESEDAKKQRKRARAKEGSKTLGHRALLGLPDMLVDSFKKAKQSAQDAIGGK